MLVRILMMPILPGQLASWLTYTRTIGFPGMRAQPGCRAVFRLRLRDDNGTHAVLTIWDNEEAFEQFRNGDAIRELSRQAQGLTVLPYTELLFDLVDDDGAAGDSIIQEMSG